MSGYNNKEVEGSTPPKDYLVKLKRKDMKFKTFYKEEVLSKYITKEEFKNIIEAINKLILKRYYKETKIKDEGLYPMIKYGIYTVLTICILLTIFILKVDLPNIINILLFILLSIILTLLIGYIYFKKVYHSSIIEVGIEQEISQYLEKLNCNKSNRLHWQFFFENKTIYICTKDKLHFE